MSHDAVTSVMRDMASLGKVRPAHIVEVRLLIEPTVAALAAQRADEDDLDRLRQYLALVPTKGTPDYVRWQIGFHRLVAQASHNPLFAMQVNIFLDFTEDMILSLRQKDRIYHDSVTHSLILEKIVARDPEGLGDFFTITCCRSSRPLTTGKRNSAPTAWWIRSPVSRSKHDLSEHLPHGHDHL